MQNWTDEEKQMLAKLKQQGLNTFQISQKMKKSTGSIRTQWLRLKDSITRQSSDLMDADKFVKVVYELADGISDSIQAPPHENLFSGRLDESAVLMLSDIHVGKVNYFLDMETGKSIETYNRKIMLEEFNALLDGIGTVNALLSQSYNIKKLYIFGLGDLVDNDMIIKGQQWYVDSGAGMQLIFAANCFSKMILELLKFYEEIEIIIVPGNHGRMTQGREKAPLGNNFDWLVGQILQRDFSNEQRVNIKTSDMWFYLQKIYDWRYLLHHGDTVYSWMSLPYYGLQRTGKSRRTEIKVDIECIGHFHQRMEIPISSKSYTLVNGSWIDRNDFAWQKFGIFSRAEQIYFGVSPKRPRTWMFNIDLRHKVKTSEIFTEAA